MTALVLVVAAHHHSWFDRHWNDVLSVISVLGGLGAALWAKSSADAAKKTVRQAERANEFPALLEFLNAYRASEQARTWILTSLRREYPDASLGVRQFSDEHRGAVLAVSHHLDQLGLLVLEGLADPDAISGYMGGSILRLWGVLGPYIQAEGKLRREGYQRYFESLAATIPDPDAIHEKLSRVDPKADRIQRWVRSLDQELAERRPPPRRRLFGLLAREAPEAARPQSRRTNPIGGQVFKYKLHDTDGGELGEAVYVSRIKAGPADGVAARVRRTWVRIL